MHWKNLKQGLRMLGWTPMIISLVLALTCVDVTAWPQDIDLKSETAFFLTNDIVGLAEHELDSTLPVDVSFSVGRVDIDLDAKVDIALSQTRLDTLPVLYRQVASLPASALEDALTQSIIQADTAIDAIRNAGGGISIDALYDQLKIIKKALDDDFIDLVDDAPDVSLMTKARLLVIVKPVEQRYDYLKYIASKVKSYALDEVKNELCSVLRQAIVAVADGDSMAYRLDLLAIIARAENYRGTMIKQEEADRIRYKADLLLRKIAENGTSRLCDVDLSTTIGDVDVDGGLTWNEADYRAPSKDVRTDGLDLTASYAGDDWTASVGYQPEWRDYADRLKNDDDRIKHSLDVSVSRNVDPWSTEVSLSLDYEFYPRDIDEEIELDRVTEASARIHYLVDRVLSLPISATLEAKLVKDLEEEGALGALDIGDRSETVDCLDDFIGHVLDAEWKGDIEPDTSKELIATARAILPRRRIYNIGVPLSLGFPFRDGDATLDLEWEGKTYPADSPLDHDTSTGKLSYTKDESTITFSGYLKREELIYLNATTKNHSLQEWEGSLDEELACGDLALTLFQQQTTYPFASKKDQSVWKLNLDVNIDLSNVSVALQWGNKVTTHPNDASKLIVQVTEMGLDTDWDIAQGSVSVSLSDEQEWNADRTDVGLAKKILAKETGQAELSWDSEVTGDLTVKLSSTCKSVINLADPSKNSTDITLQAEIALAM